MAYRKEQVINETIVIHACDCRPVARPIEVVYAAGFARGLKADTTAYLGFIEAKIEK